MNPEDVESQLRQLAAARGAILNVNANGHFQIRGLLLVNYYPFAKKRTAYVAATTRGRTRVTPEQAVAMAFEAPPIAPVTRKDRRGNSGKYQRWKRKQWAMGLRECHWQCGGPLMVRDHTSPWHFTVDHKIPLHRGGLDNPNNFVGAHSICNQRRGHDMPELHKDGHGKQQD